MVILSGMRPTGKLHIGHLKGVLSEWVRLQNEGNLCFFLVADIHALTTEDKDIRENSLEMVKDWVASGISPEKSTIFLQSDVPEHAELFLYLSMVTPLGLLERNPTYKEMREELGEEKTANLGFFSYPVLQAADILLYRAEGVPVGKDQVPHIEIARDIAEKFNFKFGNVFPLPKEILSQTPKILGMDGRKMSKSYGNAIFLTDDVKEIERKIKVYMTDTQRKRRYDPGEPERCPLWTLHKVFSPDNIQRECADGCRTARIGCIDCKSELLKYIVPEILAFQEKRKKIEDVADILNEGKKRARERGSETMQIVKSKIFNG